MKRKILLFISIMITCVGLTGCISVDDTEDTTKKEEKVKKSLDFKNEDYTLKFKKIEVLKVKNEDTGKKKNIILVHYNFKNKSSEGLTFYDVASLELYQDGKELMVNDADYYPQKRDKLVTNCDVKVKDGASIDVAEYHGMRNSSSPVEISLTVNFTDGDSVFAGKKSFQIK